VVLPAAVRGRSFRLDVLAARFAPGTPAGVKQRRAVGIGEVRGAGIERPRVPRGGSVDLPCGAAAIVLDGRRVALGGRVDRGAFDAGRPLRVRACDPASQGHGAERSRRAIPAPPVALPAGSATLIGLDAPLRADGVRLRSPAPAPVAAPAWSGRVVDPGRAGDAGRDGVRLAATGPSWLVLGQSYDAVWRARCDGRDLGAPRPMQGFANAWPVSASCRKASFAYGPQRAATIGYVVSALGCLGLLVLLLAGRRRLAATPAPAPLPAPPERPHRLGPRRAVLVGVLAAAVLGFCFGLRTGIVLGPLLGLVLWRGVPDRVLVLAAGALLAIGVPLAYVLAALLADAGNPGGYDTSYATDRIVGHWLVLAALTALGLVLWRTLAAARPRPRPPAADPGSAAAGEPLPSALVTSGPPAPTP
jgi:arabinofuranan 3-O-arabinosyltransferase